MTARLLVGDVRARIREIPDGTVDLVCTSVPFWALRKYGESEDEMGAEPTPRDYIEAQLELVAEFRRVLAPHGSIAIEHGDTYSGSGGAGGDYNDEGLRAGQPKFRQGTPRWDGRPDGQVRTTTSDPVTYPPRDKNGSPLPKSLCGIPEAFMLSLAYGWNVLRRDAPDSPAGRWRVRNVIVWARPNPPVGALGDKCRPATSYITVACTSDKRFFDLDAVRSEPTASEGRSRSSGTKGSLESDRVALNGRKGMTIRTDSAPGGAPPLDWWEDDDPTGHATLILPTQPYKGWTTTTRQVPCGPLDGGVRTTSPDCPWHADQPAPLPKVRRDVRAGVLSNSTSHNGTHHEQGSLLDSVPTAPHTEPTTVLSTTDSLDPPYSPSATPHSKGTRRTDPAPSTAQLDKPYGGTSDRTDGTPTTPASSAPNHDTEASRTCEDESASRAHEMASDTAHTPDPLSACTCSFHLSIEESTSHYATWPSSLAKRLIEMMCPLRVCVTCGEPSRRIVGVGLLGDGLNKHSMTRQSPTLGWTDCGCERCIHGREFDHCIYECHHWRKGHVLDPFAGSGTTLAVAQGCGRDATGIELYQANADLIADRLGMFLEIVGGPDAA